MSDQWHATFRLLFTEVLLVYLDACGLEDELRKVFKDPGERQWEVLIRLFGQVVEHRDEPQRPGQITNSVVVQQLEDAAVALVVEGGKLDAVAEDDAQQRCEQDLALDVELSWVVSVDDEAEEEQERL